LLHIVIEEFALLRLHGVILSVQIPCSAIRFFRYAPTSRRRNFAPSRAAKRFWLARVDRTSAVECRGLQTKAVKKGDTYVIIRHQGVDHNGGVADRRSSTRTRIPRGRKESRHRAEKGTPGFKVGKEEEARHHATACSELVFTDCVVRGNRIGTKEKATKSLSTLDGGRIGIASQAVGIASGAFEAALKWSQDAWRSGIPSRSFSHSVHARRHGTEIARRGLLVRKRRGAGLRRRFSQEAPTAKCLPAKLSTRVAHKAIQDSRRYGYSKNSRRAGDRDARITEIYEAPANSAVVLAGWLLKS